MRGGDDMPNWWDSRDNLALVTSYLASHDPDDAERVAYCVEKPWKFTEEFKAAKAELDS